MIRHRNSSVWSFPKGHMERGESEKQTALREIGEETGVMNVCLDTRFRRTLAYYARANVKKLVVFFVGEGDGEALSEKITDAIVQEAKWVDTNEAEQLLAFENHRTLFAAARGYYRRHKRNFSEKREEQATEPEA